MIYTCHGGYGYHGYGYGYGHGYRKPYPYLYLWYPYQCTHQVYLYLCWSLRRGRTRTTEAWDAWSLRFFLLSGMFFLIIYFLFYIEIYWYYLQLHCRWQPQSYLPRQAAISRTTTTGMRMTEAWDTSVSWAQAHFFFFSLCVLLILTNGFYFI